MNDISIGAVGAALVAGLFSFLGLVLSKEQKVSEFRQAWINDVRECLVAYLVHINAIADLVRLKAKGEAVDAAKLVESYSALNRASHGIRLRVNPAEKPAKALLRAMRRFEALADSNSSLTPENIRAAEKGFIKSSRKLLKFEWSRVKRGEEIFVWTKWGIAGVTAALILVLAISWLTRPLPTAHPATPQPPAASPNKGPGAETAPAPAVRPPA